MAASLKYSLVMVAVGGGEGIDGYCSGCIPTVQQTCAGPHRIHLDETSTQAVGMQPCGSVEVTRYRALSKVVVSWADSNGVGSNHWNVKWRKCLEEFEMLLIIHCL